MARVLIAGAGALGSVFGGFLRRAGHEVVLLGRPGHLDAIAASGLHIEGLWGEHHIIGFGLSRDAETLQGEFDAILLTVKSYDTEVMGNAVAGRLAGNGVMISLQNGLGNVEALGAICPGRVLGGRVIFGAETVAPGRVRVTVYADPVLIGAPHPASDTGLEAQAHEWATTFAVSGIPSAYCADIQAALWGKVLYNAALNPLGALLGVHYGALGEDANTRAIIDRAIEETFRVGVAEQVALPWASAAAYRSVFYDRLLPSTFHHRPSMLQDLERGRPTEIDAINGEVWKRGAAHGIVTPVNEILTRLVHGREALARARPR